MTVPLITNTVSNPITGTFGNGVIVPFLTSTTFYVPAGVDSVRVRLWSGGSLGGGGFSYRTITGLISGAAIAVTVGAAGGSSSFGPYCSATGGTSTTGGSGSGGDINSNGGTGGSNMGGGVGGLFGNGGSNSGGSGNAGGGGGNTAGNVAGNGVFGSGGQYQSTTVTTYPTSGMISASIDFFGTGGGGPNVIGGLNGGGGGTSAPGGFPGGGGTSGARGLVIVEY